MGLVSYLCGCAKDLSKEAIQGAFQAVVNAAAQPNDTFTHPGTLMGPRETKLCRMRVAAGAEPWAGAARALLAATPRQYTPNALARVHIDYNGVGQGHDELVERDGRAAYQAALAWLVTGDDQYARNAAAIIRAWATVNVSFTGQNAPLEAAWGVTVLARAAELLKHTWPGWTADLSTAFHRWVDRLILPALRSDALTRLPRGNWHTAVAECKAQLAILRGDRALFAEALAGWRKVAAAYLLQTGECAETRRDLYHSQFGLGGLVQTAELAWQQGVDLYSLNGNALLRALETHAYITNGGVPRACCYPLKGIGFLPCGWEVALNHYAGRCGLAMPETEKMLARHRPERVVFCWGAGTLTHFGAAQGLAAGQDVEDEEVLPAQRR